MLSAAALIFGSGKKASQHAVQSNSDTIKVRNLKDKSFVAPCVSAQRPTRPVFPAFFLFHSTQEKPRHICFLLQSQKTFQIQHHNYLSLGKMDMYLTVLVWVFLQIYSTTCSFWFAVLQQFNTKNNIIQDCMRLYTRPFDWLIEFSHKLMPKPTPWLQGSKTPSGREKRTAYSPYKDKTAIEQKYSETAASPKKQKKNRNKRGHNQLLGNYVWLSGPICPP